SRMSWIFSRRGGSASFFKSFRLHRCADSRSAKALWKRSAWIPCRLSRSNSAYLRGWRSPISYFSPGPHLKPTDPVFWFMMQVGMILGFFTAYPANRFLLVKDWKEKMPQYMDQMRRKMRDEQGHPRPA